MKKLHSHCLEPAPREESVSPFVLEFFMVQCAGFRHMAYRNAQGKWRRAFDDEELCGEVWPLE